MYEDFRRFIRGSRVFVRFVFRKLGREIYEESRLEWGGYSVVRRFINSLVGFFFRRYFFLFVDFLRFLV